VATAVHSCSCVAMASSARWRVRPKSSANAGPLWSCANCGSQRFNDIRRGVPRMSPTLLAQRLRKLEEIGVVRRERGRTGLEYRLTEAGEELRPIVVQLGHWGARWVGSRLKREELDAGFLMWDVRRFARVDGFLANDAS